jgi:plastocyanin
MRTAPRTARITGFLSLCLYLFPAAAMPSDIEGQIIVRAARDNSDAVVYIDKIPGKRFPAPASPVLLDQVNLRFVPHVLPVLAGTTVAFPNSDEVRHNVFSPGPPRFDLGTYPQKTTKYRLFDTSGVWTLLCNVHVEMSAYVVVTETPYFTKTGQDGKYVLKDVPPGKYTLKFWHEKAKPVNIPIEVGEAGTVTIPPVELKR